MSFGLDAHADRTATAPRAIGIRICLGKECSRDLVLALRGTLGLRIAMMKARANETGKVGADA